MLDAHAHAHAHGHAHALYIHTYMRMPFGSRMPSGSSGDPHLRLARMRMRIMPSGSQGDPHLRLPHGGVADFKGEDGTFFVCQ